MRPLKSVHVITDEYVAVKYLHTYQSGDAYFFGVAEHAIFTFHTKDLQIGTETNKIQELC